MKNFKLNPYLIAAIAIIVVIIIVRSRANAQDNSSILNSGSSGGTGNYSAPPTTSAGSTGTPSQNSNTNGLPVLGKDTPLSRGAYGYEVRLIQQTYNTYYAPGKGKTLLTLDGQFGPKTEAAIEESTGKSTISYNDYFDRVTGFGNIFDPFADFQSSDSSDKTFSDVIDSGEAEWWAWAFWDY